MSDIGQELHFSQIQQQELWNLSCNTSGSDRTSNFYDFSL